MGGGISVVAVGSDLRFWSCGFSPLERTWEAETVLEKGRTGEAKRIKIKCFVLIVFSCSKLM
jgi:hypothetical protein